MGTNGLFLIAQLIHKNAKLGVRLLSNVSVGPKERSAATETGNT